MIKKYCCNNCNKTFSRKAHLIDHENKKNKCIKNINIINDTHITQNNSKKHENVQNLSVNQVNQAN